MVSQLYLWSGIRERKIFEINNYKDAYRKIIDNDYIDIEKQASVYEKEMYRKLGSGCSYEDVDEYSIAQQANEMAVDFYQEKDLMKYNITSMWLSTLFQFWEQQCRQFFANEMNIYYYIDPKKFCANGFREIKEVLEYHNVDVNNLSSWKNIDRLRLLCNTIKHGDGNSADKLREVEPSIFLKVWGSEDELIELYNSSLLERVLDIDETTYYNFCDSIIEFWNELPERMYSE